MREKQKKSPVNIKCFTFFVHESSFNFAFLKTMHFVHTNHKIESIVRHLVGNPTTSAPALFPKLTKSSHRITVAVTAVFSDYRLPLNISQVLALHIQKYQGYLRMIYTVQNEFVFINCKNCNHESKFDLGLPQE